MSIFRVHSSDKQVFVNNTRLLGVQNCDIETSKAFEEIRPIGNIKITDRVLTSNQTTNLSIDFMLNDSLQNDPFFDFQTSGILSVETFDFNVKDLIGESVISGAYLSSYSVRGAVNELVQGSVSYECDIIDFNTTGYLTYLDQSSDTFNVYQPQDISIISNFDEGVSTSGLCIQNFDLSFSIDRTAKNRLGTRTPRLRYPNLPIKGGLKFSVIKNRITGIDLSPLIMGSGDLSIKLNANMLNEREYLIKNCSLVSISETHGLDDNAIFDFEYVFSIDNTGLTVVGS